MPLLAIVQALLEGLPVILGLLKSDQVQAAVDLLERLIGTLRGRMDPDDVLAHIRSFDMEPFPPGDDDEDPLEAFGTSD